MDQASSTATSLDADSVVRRNGQPAAAAISPGSGAPHDGPGPSDAVRTVALKKALRTKYRHTAAVHSQSRPSTLSHDATDTPSFLGFRNLGLIVLIAGNLRLVLENIQKYGVLICVRCHDFRRQDLQVGFVLYTLVPCCLLLAYLIELFAAYEARTSKLRAFNNSWRGKGGGADGAGAGAGARTKDEGSDGTCSPTEDQQARFRRIWYTVVALHLVNISLALIVTSWGVFSYVNHPLIGTIVEMHAIIVWLKTASYALTNRDLRHAYLHPQKGELDAIPELYRSCSYPSNVTFGNLCYFWWAPTLIYQPVYPRTDKIRWLFVLKRVGECFGLCVVMWVLSAQYAAPTLQNSVRAWQEWDVPGLFERILKLSTISLVIWLAGFFALFQSFLNALAEVMKFADRSFYDDCTSSKSPADVARSDGA